MGDFKKLLFSILIFMSGFFLAAPCWAQTPETPHQIILKLKQDLTLVGEKRGDARDFAKAVDAARENLHDYMQKGVNPYAFVERDASGMTPLIVASFEGYGDIVEELLQNKLVVQHIDALDNKGLSAWMYANFALKQTLWLCNPAAAQNPYVFTPLRVVQPYYDNAVKGETPYQKTRRLLVSAGAKADVVLLKQQWHALCRMEYPATADQVDRAKDLQAAMVTEASAQLPGLLKGK
jgi:hypothetical protein